jgi:hypothetical protein
MLGPNRLDSTVDDEANLRREAKFARAQVERQTIVATVVRSDGMETCGRVESRETARHST